MRIDNLTAIGRITLAVCLGATRLDGQASEACSLGPYFAFQIDAPAVFQSVRESNTVKAPVLTPAASANVVQFLVDTAGKPAPASFKVLRESDPAVINAARAALPHWQFTKPRRGKCAVLQVVQLRLGK